MFSQNLICKLYHLPKLTARHGLFTKGLQTLSQPTKQSRLYTTVPPSMRPSGPQISGGHAPKPKMTTIGGLREFLLHPLTWDRNNGYFNILLGLAIFGYCFCTACKSEGPRTVSYEQKGKK
uniref:Iron stress-induced chlorophyll-binding protein n=1 Tax=Zeugodacus cucurbitae TaxID=28588 RepID=A0A0A1X1N8_ZEUCU